MLTKPNITYTLINISDKLKEDGGDVVFYVLRRGALRFNQINLRKIGRGQRSQNTH